MSEKAACTQLLTVPSPTWFQLVQAHDPTEAGLQLLPYLVGMVVVGILYSPLLRLVNSILFSLHLDDWKPKPVLIHSGCALFLLGTCLIATMSTTVPAVSLVFLFLLFGAGTGLVLQTSFLAAQASVDSEGECTSLSCSIRRTSLPELNSQELTTCVAVQI